MGFMVFGIDDLTFIAQFFFYEVGNPKFLLDPDGHGFPKGHDTRRSIGEIALQQPLKFDEGLVVKGNVVEIPALIFAELRQYCIGVSLES